MQRTSRLAFTLVELSIVLVILGLLVGGVLAGQSLIHAAELRSVSNEFTSYKTALNAFREKYNALPGDMPNAVRFWGAADGGTADGSDATCDAVTTAAVGTETCNGNGNRWIGGHMGDWEVPTEWFRAWQQMKNAGLVEGNFSGVAGPIDGWDCVIGVNVPRSRYPGAGWTLMGEGAVPDDAAWFGGNYGHMLIFGSQQPGGAVTTGDPVLKPEDAFNIDTKMDDGKPGTGLIRTHKNGHIPDCVAADDENYLLSGQTNGCYLFFTNVI